MNTIILNNIFFFFIYSGPPPEKIIIMFSASEKQNTFSFVNLKIQLNLFYTRKTDLCYNSLSYEPASG